MRLSNEQVDAIASMLRRDWDIGKGKGRLIVRDVAREIGRVGEGGGIASASTILSMADGRGIDLLNVRAEDIDFAVIAEHIAKENRFNGATPDVVYPVAQHLCIGTEEMLLAGATEAEAAYFHVHDCPEAFWKDDPTPKKCAIAKRISERCGVTAESVLGVLKGIDTEHEAAVHQAARLPYPIPEQIARIVKLYDIKMFVTEWRDLMLSRPHPDWSPYEGVTPFARVIKPWPWKVAASRWLEMAHELLPALRRKRAKP